MVRASRAWPCPATSGFDHARSDLDQALAERDFSAQRYVYVWADGVYLQARMEANAECMLVLIGATAEGKKELVGFQTGVRESAQSWRELLIDIKRRGLEIAPVSYLRRGGTNSSVP
jgi:transposase-like protein